MKKIDSFPAADGHIESILIGVWQVKISFQTWNSRQLILIYNDVESITSSESVYHDIDAYDIDQTNNNKFIYTFYYSKNSSELKAVLTIYAGTMEIYETGKLASDINSALFDVGYDYVGDQIYNFK